MSNNVFALYSDSLTFGDGVPQADGSIVEWQPNMEIDHIVTMADNPPYKIGDSVLDRNGERLPIIMVERPSPHLLWIPWWENHNGVPVEDQAEKVTDQVDDNVYYMAHLASDIVRQIFLDDNQALANRIYLNGASNVLRDITAQIGDTKDTKATAELCLVAAEVALRTTLELMHTKYQEEKEEEEHE